MWYTLGELGSGPQSSGPRPGGELSSRVQPDFFTEGVDFSKSAANESDGLIRYEVVCVPCDRGESVSFSFAGMN